MPISVRKKIILSVPMAMTMWLCSENWATKQFLKQTDRSLMQ